MKNAEGNSYDTEEEDLKWMVDFGCDDVIEEKPELEKLRPAWKRLLSELKHGDTLVILKFSNVLRATRQLPLLLELCRIKSIRLISIHDKIDTKGELFGDTRVTDVLNMIALLPMEANSLRKSAGSAGKLRGRITQI